MTEKSLSQLDTKLAGIFQSGGVRRSPQSPNRAAVNSGGSLQKSPAGTPYSHAQLVARREERKQRRDLGKGLPPGVYDDRVETLPDIQSKAELARNEEAAQFFDSTKSQAIDQWDKIVLFNAEEFERQRQQERLEQMEKKLRVREDLHQQVIERRKVLERSRIQEQEFVES